MPFICLFSFSRPSYVHHGKSLHLDKLVFISKWGPGHHCLPKKVEGWYAKPIRVWFSEDDKSSNMTCYYKWMTIEIQHFVLEHKIWDASSERLGWKLNDLFDGESRFVQVMAWWHQATSHYLNQCWPRFTDAIWCLLATMGEWDVTVVCSIQSTRVRGYS